MEPTAGKKEVRVKPLPHVIQGKEILFREEDVGVCAASTGRPSFVSVKCLLAQLLARKPKHLNNIRNKSTAESCAGRWNKNNNQ